MLSVSWSFVILMNRTFDFATIGFRPFPETQEFVTIGAVTLEFHNSLKIRVIRGFKCGIQVEYS